jgi:type IV secretory pathway TrbL component
LIIGLILIFIAGIFLVMWLSVFFMFLPLIIFLVGMSMHNWLLMIAGIVTAPLWIKLGKKFNEAKKERAAKEAADKARRMNKYL